MSVGGVGGKGPIELPESQQTIDTKQDVQQAAPHQFTDGIVGAQQVAGNVLDAVSGNQQVAHGSVEQLQMMLTAVIHGDTHSIPNEDQMPNYDQGSTNGCGTTSLAMILSYLTGQSITQGDIDKAIRRMDVFTSPRDLLEYAQDMGLAAEGYNNGTWEELKGYIDRGLPCQALISADGSSDPTKLHYIAVTGYGKDATTGEETVIYHDPATGKEETMLLSEFKQKWSAPIGGFENYFNVYGPAGTDLPSSRFDGIEGTTCFSEGFANMTNNLNRLYDPDSVGSWFHGLIGLPGGVIETVGGVIGGGVSLFGQWINDGVEGIPVVENIVQPFGDLFDGVGSAFSDVVGGFGEAFDSWGGGFEALFDGDVGGFFSGIGEGFLDIGSGIVEGVGDFFGGVADAVGDFFSGW
ncbi:MAG TPA: C39 family peptidase [Acidobacteriota bacterium]|nr:C39 family peptidase [Acidobacteriota bacterium]HQG91864.1 C39 family peptidase [Acidobacteriota bacterium]